METQQAALEGLFYKTYTGKYVITHLCRLTEYITAGVKPDANVASGLSLVKQGPFSWVAYCGARRVWLGPVFPLNFAINLKIRSLLILKNNKKWPS